MSLKLESFVAVGKIWQKLESLNELGKLSRKLKSVTAHQTSADKDTESPDRSVLSLSSRTHRQRTALFRKFRTESGQAKCGQKDIGQSFFYKNQDIFCCIKNNLITIESNLRVRGLQIFDVHVRVRDSEKFPF